MVPFRRSGDPFVLIALLLIAPRVARSDELPSPLALADLIAAARARNPALAGRRKTAAAAALRPRAAAQPEDPTASFEWWQQPIDFSTVPLQLTLKQTLPWPGKLRLRRELAEREARMRADDADEAERAVAAEAKRAYFDLALAERSLSVNAMVRTLIESLVHVTDAQYRVGRAVQADLLRAQMELLEAQNERLDLERNRETAAAQLNGLLDRAAGEPIGPTATAPATVSLPPEAELLGRATARRPEVRRAEVALAAADAKSALAQREDAPDVSVWAGYMVNIRGVDTFTAGVSSTLPIFSSVRKRALLAAAQADRAAAQHALEAIRRQTDVELHSALLQLEAAARHVRLHAEQLIPLADLSLQSAEASYQAGRVPFVAVIEAARAVRDHHSNHLKFLVEYERRLADLEQLVGEELR